MLKKNHFSLASDKMANFYTVKRKIDCQSPYILISPSGIKSNQDVRKFCCPTTDFILGVSMICFQKSLFPGFLKAF